MIIAVDFDGVIHDPHNRLPGFRLGQPVAGAVEAMQQLRDAGHVLVIHSVRGRTVREAKVMQEWLNYFGVPYDLIAAVKPEADVYLDDKAIRFESWHQAIEAIR